MTEPQQHTGPRTGADQAAPTDTTDADALTASRTLQISSSPRSTWLWAPDQDTVDHVRQVLGGWRPVRHRGEDMPLVMDIDIGVTAYETCLKLADAGFTFGWHESEHPLNRHNWPSQLPGMPDAGQPA